MKKFAICNASAGGCAEIIDLENGKYALIDTKNLSTQLHTPIDELGSRVGLDVILLSHKQVSRLSMCVITRQVSVSRHITLDFAQDGGFTVNAGKVTLKFTAEELESFERRASEYLDGLEKQTAKPINVAI